MILIKNLRILPATWARTKCSFSRRTRKNALGKTSITLPVISIASVFSVFGGLRPAPPPTYSWHSFLPCSTLSCLLGRLRAALYVYSAKEPLEKKGKRKNKK